MLATDSDLAAYLLNAFGLSSVPGQAFNAPGFIRLSIAASDDELVQACVRLKQMVESLN
ncbi:aspartate aminotransferase [compost metagenome]